MSLRAFFIFLYLSANVLLFGADANQSVKSAEDGIQAANAEQVVFTSYEKTPLLLYKNEIFEIKIRALTASSEAGELRASLQNGVGIKALNANQKWKVASDGSNTLSLYFKAVDQNVRLPDIKTTLVIGGVEIESALLEGFTLNAPPVIPSPKYCGVVASELKIENYKIDDYDAKNNILALDISAINANLEDFKLQGVQIQGVSSVKNSYESGKMFYYLIIPNTLKSVEFEYFNKIRNGMEQVSLSLDLSKLEEKVSTQTDLQPKSSDKALFVFLTVVVIAAGLYAAYYFKREKIYLILIAVVVTAGALFLLIPNEEIKIKKDTIVYLLPTENSTPFFKASADMPVEKLKTSEGYVKIKLQDGKIGWVKGEAIASH